MKLVTKNGEPVKIGSVIAIATNNSSKTNINIVTITEENSKKLVEDGILKEVENEKVSTLDNKKLAKSAKDFYKTMTEGDSEFDRIRKTIRFIAIVIDSAYPDNIKNLKSTLYYVDIYNDLKIQSTDAGYLKNYYKSVGYGLFRTASEAKLAVDIIIENIINGK